MRFSKGGKTFQFLQAEKCNGSQQWTSTGPSSQHILESVATAKSSLRDRTPHVLGGEMPRQRVPCPFPDHSLSQRGMAWCQVPSAWQTAVKDGSFRLPCMGAENISVGSSESPIPSPPVKCCSICPSFHCCPVAAPLQFQPLSSPFPASPLPRVCHGLQILRSRPRHEQPATIKNGTRSGVQLSPGKRTARETGNVFCFKPEITSFQRDTLVYQRSPGSSSLVFCGDSVNQ